jgi:hypothetical protein
MSTNVETLKKTEFQADDLAIELFESTIGANPFGVRVYPTDVNNENLELTRYPTLEKAKKHYNEVVTQYLYSNPGIKPTIVKTASISEILRKIANIIKR